MMQRDFLFNVGQKVRYVGEDEKYNIEGEITCVAYDGDNLYWIGPFNKAGNWYAEDVLEVGE